MHLAQGFGHVGHAHQQPGSHPRLPCAHQGWNWAELGATITRHLKGCQGLFPYQEGQWHANMITGPIIGALTAVSPA